MFFHPGARGAAPIMFGETEGATARGAAAVESLGFVLNAILRDLPPRPSVRHSMRASSVRVPPETLANGSAASARACAPVDLGQSTLVGWAADRRGPLRRPAWKHEKALRLRESRRRIPVSTKLNDSWSCSPRDPRPQVGAPCTSRAVQRYAPGWQSTAQHEPHRGPPADTRAGRATRGSCRRFTSIHTVGRVQSSTTTESGFRRVPQPFHREPARHASGTRRARPRR